MHTEPQHVPAIIHALSPLITKYGYLAVGGLLLVEDFGVPAPGETVLIAASFYAGLGQLNIVVVGLVAFLAAVIGDNIGFAIGEYGGRPVVERFGKYVFLTPARLDKAEAFFTRHGGKVVTIARFFEGLRQLNGIIAGLSDMKWPKFIIFNALGAAIWVTFWSTVAYTSGTHIETFLQYQKLITIIVVALVAAYIVFRIVKQRRKPVEQSSEHKAKSQGNQRPTPRS